MKAVKIYAIGDLHLGHSVHKPMDIFGPQWKDHAARIAESWNQLIRPKDLVLIPGDLSWAMRMPEAEADLHWLDALPGMKLLIKGNHDYWWPSISRLRERLKGGSIHPLQYDSISVGSVAVGGTRLWTLSDIQASYRDPLETQGSGGNDAPAGSQEEERTREEKIFKRELGRLESSLGSMDPHSALRIVMTHFPPTCEQGKDTPATSVLEKHRVDICVFGHLHSLNLPGGKTWDFVKNGVRYVLASCDAVGFAPYFLCEVIPRSSGSLD